MCGRYALHSHPDVIALQFKLGPLPEFEPRYNICPSAEILIVRDAPGRGRAWAHYRWGLIPGWAKDPGIGNRLANARGETLAARPAFKAAFRQWRCLVPASGFYEWHATRSGKQPYYIRPAGDELFGLAGITELWNGLHTVSLITTDSNALLQGIHDRMPVIVAPQAYDAWLDPSSRDVERLKKFIRPYPADLMRAHPVSKAVSNAANEGAALIEPI
jgi:putative SOS response-associated peptidase YedK